MTCIHKKKWYNKSKRKSKRNKSQTMLTLQQ